jgi:hypothetical protein
MEAVAVGKYPPREGSCLYTPSILFTERVQRRMLECLGTSARMRHVVFLLLPQQGPVVKGAVRFHGYAPLLQHEVAASATPCFNCLFNAYFHGTKEGRR